MKLGDARVDKHEDARRKKKQEIVETFKSHFTGVVSCVVSVWFSVYPYPNLCILRVYGKQ